MNDAELFRRIVEPSAGFGGYFTVMREGCEWRVGFGTPDRVNAETAQNTPLKAARTFREAAIKALAANEFADCVFGLEERILSGDHGDGRLDQVSGNYDF